MLEKRQEQQRYWNNKGIKMASEAPGRSYFIVIYFLGGRIRKCGGGVGVGEGVKNWPQVC